MTPLPRRAVPPRTDAVLAAAALAASLVQVAVAPIASPAVSLVLAVAQTLPLAWRRVAPLTAALVLTAGWLVPTHGFLLLGYVVAGLVFWSVGAQVRPLAPVLAVSGLAGTVGVVVTLLGPEAPPQAIGAVLVVLGPVAAGRLVAHQRAQAARLRALGEELVRERAAAERAVVAEERTRIARELHDVIGHELTVIALQADAAAAALAVAPERAVAPVQAVRGCAAEALGELRRVVGLLRGPDDDPLRPQPGLAEVPALVERARAGGLAVELSLHPPSAAPPSSLQLAAYRVVQEGLTNAARHAPGAVVRVRVRGDGDALDVAVHSSGGQAGGPAGTGSGLVGLRERVALHGGELSAGPVADGFALTARLPLPALDGAR